jgi:Predicted thioesterase
VKRLQSTFSIKIRFSEIDAMRVVWHGAYAKYFEDAREYFGEQYGIGYTTIEQSGHFAPIVDLQIQYKKPLTYGMTPEITITYVPTDAAKIVFDYEIRNQATQEVMVTGRTVQVFMDLNYELVWTNPEFYEAWKQKWLE